MTTKLTTTVGAAAAVTALFVGTAPIAEAQPRGYSVRNTTQSVRT